MAQVSTRSAVGILICLLIAAAVVAAVSQANARYAAIPVVAICALIAFAIQWVAFIPAYLRQTEHFFDLIGSVSYLSVVMTALLLGGFTDGRSLLLAGMVFVWAIRLGTFLFMRISKDGSDGRFDTIKPNALRFLLTWTLQGLWVFLTLVAALTAIGSLERAPLGWTAAIGFVLWLFGFAVEAISDRQKRVHRQLPENQGQFIQTGLWSWSRHPNYFGEIVLWIGVAIVAAPNLSGWQWVAMVSPLFVFILLTRVSGVPLLEKRADEKWGKDPSYLAYKERTPVLFLRPPQSRK